jgi:hypothetical protein
VPPRRIGGPRHLKPTEFSLFSGFPESEAATVVNYTIKPASDWHRSQSEAATVVNYIYSLAPLTRHARERGIFSQILWPKEATEFIKKNSDPCQGPSENFCHFPKFQKISPALPLYFARKIEKRRFSIYWQK